MCGDRWIFVLALCFMSASSSEFEESCGQRSQLCEAHTVSASLGSSALLPCNFTAADLGMVSWAHAAGENLTLLNLTADGRVKFLFPKKGRVKVFPNHSSRGNYSIRIDDLQESDLGCYCCQQGEKCHQVDLRVTPDMLSQAIWYLIYACVAVVTFILLVVSCYSLHRKRKQGSSNLLMNDDSEGERDPPAPIGPVPQHELPRDNDDQSYCGPLDLPYLNPAQPTQRLELQRTIHRFQREVFNTSGNTPITHHYYVNQDEIRNQHATSAASGNHQRGFRKKKKAKESQEYKNPIYGRGTEQLNL